VVAGNFNLTNVDELFNKLIDLGQYPIETSDTVTILEKIGHFLDEENEELYWKFKGQGFKKREITFEIARQLNIQKILRESAKYWDGVMLLRDYSATGILLLCGIHRASGLRFISRMTK